VRLSYSPDSRYLAYDFPVANNAGKFDISLLPVDGSAEIPLVRHPANDRLLGWVKDTSEILFSSDRYGTEDAWAVRVVDNKPQDPPELIRRSVGEIRPMGFTREGTFFFGVPTRQFTVQIASYDPEKAGLQVSTEKTLLGSNILGGWSPDGNRIVYLTEEKDEQGVARGVHIRDLTTGKERELARELNVRYARWSPDGRSVVVEGKEASSKEADYRGGIYQIDADTGHVTRLVLFADSVPAWWVKRALWSRVGESIIYADRGCLWTRELKSGQEKELYCHANLAPFSALSPDGRGFTFGSVDETKNTVTIWVMQIAGGKASRLLTVPGSRNVARTIGGIDWTPDGKYLVYAKDEGDGYGVYQIPATGGDAQKIYHSKDRYFLGLSVHPDGKQIALSTGVQGDEVWVMEYLRRPKRNAGVRP
jgi:Tol biopolymer transport system component